MYCPKCGYEQFCPFGCCIERLPIGKFPYIWTQMDDVDAQECISCGFTETIDWWLDYEWDIAVEGGRIERPPDYGIFVNWDGIEINYI